VDARSPCQGWTRNTRRPPVGVQGRGWNSTRRVSCPGRGPARAYPTRNRETNLATGRSCGRIVHGRHATFLGLGRLVCGLLPDVAGGAADRLITTLCVQVGDAHDTHPGRGLASRIDAVAIRLRAELNRVATILRHRDCDPPSAGGVAHLHVEALARPTTSFGLWPCPPSPYQRVVHFATNLSMGGLSLLNDSRPGGVASPGPAAIGSHRRRADGPWIPRRPGRPTAVAAACRSATPIARRQLAISD
jgi:hypothetical protein